MYEILQRFPRFFNFGWVQAPCHQPLWDRNSEGDDTFQLLMGDKAADYFADRRGCIPMSSYATDDEQVDGNAEILDYGVVVALRVSVPWYIEGAAAIRRIIRG